MAKKSIEVVQEPISPMALQVPEQQINCMVNHTKFFPEFTGIARSVQCYKNGVHNNFRILTLHIDKGQVQKMDVSDPFANFECIDKLNWWNENSVINLNNNWLDERTLSK